MIESAFEPPTIIVSLSTLVKLPSTVMYSYSLSTVLLMVVTPSTSPAIEIMSSSGL